MFNSLFCCIGFFTTCANVFGLVIRVVNTNPPEVILVRFSSSLRPMALMTIKPELAIKSGKVKGPDASTSKERLSERP